MRRSNISLDPKLGIPFCYAKFFKHSNKDDQSQQQNNFIIHIEVNKKKGRRKSTIATWDPKDKRCTSKELSEIKTTLQQTFQTTCTVKEKPKISIELFGNKPDELKYFLIDYFELNEENVQIKSFKLDISKNYKMIIIDDEPLEISWCPRFEPKNMEEKFKDIIQNNWKIDFTFEATHKKTTFKIKKYYMQEVLKFFTDTWNMSYDQIEFQERNIQLKREPTQIVEIDFNYPRDPFNEMKETFSDFKKKTYFKEMCETIVDMHSLEKEKYKKLTIKTDLEFKKMKNNKKGSNFWMTQFDATKRFSIDRLESGHGVTEGDTVVIQYRNNTIRGIIKDIEKGIVTANFLIPYGSVPPGYEGKETGNASDDEDNNEEEEDEDEKDKREYEEFIKNQMNKEEEEKKEKEIINDDENIDEILENAIKEAEKDDEIDKNGKYLISFERSDIIYQRSALGLLNLNSMASSPIKNIIISDNIRNSAKDNKITIENASFDLTKSEFINNDDRKNEKFMKIIKMKAKIQQTRCVEMVMNNHISVIHGPPGCGKTSSIGLFIYHLLRQSMGEKKRILCCAYSNQAVENIVKFVSPIIRAMGKKMIWIAKKSKEFENRKQCENASEEEKNLTIYKIMNRQTIEAKKFQQLQQSKWEFYGELKAKKKWKKIKKIKLKKTPKFPDSILKEMDRLREVCETNMIFESDVVCCTLLTSAKKNLCKYRFHTVFIDEASQASEISSIIPLIHQPSNLVLLGDHNQLGVYVDKSIKKKHPSTTKSLYKKLLIKGVKSVMLNIQFRMHPLIVAFPNKEFYRGRIHNAGTVEKETRIELQSVPTPIAFVDVDYGEEKRRKRDKSYINIEEAKIVERLVNNLKINDVPGSEVGVITPYFGQSRLIFYLTKHLEYEGLKISCIDNFQGCEKDFIILSVVRTNQQGNFGFLALRKRINVALTRARKGMIIVGNFHAINLNTDNVRNQVLIDLCKFYHQNKAVMKDEEIKRELHKIEKAKKNKGSIFDHMKSETNTAFNDEDDDENVYDDDDYDVDYDDEDDDIDNDNLYK